MKTVRILGTSRNLGVMPRTPAGTDVWVANSRRSYNKLLPRVISEGEWTRWFNLHSRAHMDETYPRDVAWWKQLDGSKPFYHQRLQVDLPGSKVFPRDAIQAFFPESPRYFSCSICWMLALAIMEGFERVEFWGVRLSDHKNTPTYAFERPCFFYWVEKARSRGITVIYPDEVGAGEPGDPATYTGPLYGFETKPEL